MYPLFFPVIATAAYVMLQIVLLRKSCGRRYFASLTGGLAGGTVVFLALEAAFLSRHHAIYDLARAILIQTPTFLALSYCYCTFVQLGQTSVRIRLYSEIAVRPQGITFEELARDYSDRALVRARIERLLESGDVAIKDERYFLGRVRLFHIANLIFAARRFLLGSSA